MTLARFWLVHVGSALVALLVAVVVLVGWVRADWWANPGEIIHTPRAAYDPETNKIIHVVEPGQKVLIGGEYETRREGCQAHFTRTVRYVSGIHGPLLVTAEHGGSFDLEVPQRAWARHVQSIPVDAQVGTYWTSDISNSWWDCLHFPLGLSRVPVSYATVRLLVDTRLSR